jgi:hypothetical protein
MKTNYPQISQITQTVETEACLLNYMGFQASASIPNLHNLCNLRSLQVGFVEGKL